MARKVIVIGLDGFEPTIAESLMAAGDLPHLAALRRRGGYTRVQTTTPAQTPVAWSTFATGTNPGGHGIFDFVRRDPRTYRPDYSLNRYEQKNAFSPPKAINLRRGVPVWDLLAEAGIASTILRCPCTYPPDLAAGRMLAGMGVPDLRGGQGTATFYTTDAGDTARDTEQVKHVRVDTAQCIATQLIGPRHPKTRTDVECPITIDLETVARRVVVRSAGQPAALAVREGEWSDWLHVRFKLGVLQSVAGMVRFYLVRIAPTFELYASPVNFDPTAPLFPISTPPDYASELGTQVGTFYTTGMVEDHNGLSDGRLSDAAFLAQCDQVLRERERMALYELDRFDRGLFFCLFDTPDRIQHMFWRAGGELDHCAVLREHYRACDAIVGRVAGHVDDDTMLIVLSDHGMNCFERGVHLNTWLHQQGLLTLRDGRQPGTEGEDDLGAIDWSRTRAYALGLSGIYLNLRGREGQGIVARDEADALQSTIVRALTGLADPARGDTAVQAVTTREQTYRGPYAPESPDLMVHFAAGYRMSWSTALGGVPAGLIEDNDRRWGGDHIMDPALVPGVLFMNRPPRQTAARLVDLAPTILAALGVPKGSSMEGESLLP